MTSVAIRVAIRYCRRQLSVYRVAARSLAAEQYAGRREEIHNLARPMNDPKGIEQRVVRNEAESKTKGEGIQTPHPKDIQPKDLFYPPLPRNVAVRNFHETGKDMSEAIRHQIPKDKGFETVKNLNQYLVRTEGGVDS